MSRRYTYARMRPKELSTALNSLDLPVGSFARLVGTTRDRALKWTDGREDIPHHIGVLCAILPLPGVMEAAKDYTDRVATRVDEEDDAND